MCIVNLFLSRIHSNRSRKIICALRFNRNTLEDFVNFLCVKVYTLGEAKNGAQNLNLKNVAVCAREYSG